MSNDHVHAHLRAILDNIANTHRAARAELREGMAAINRVNRQTMSNELPGYDAWKTDMSGTPYGAMTREEERQMEADAEVERLHTEVARQESVIADLDEALTKIAEIAGDYGDGAPDSHYLAVLMLQLESIATSALDEARGTHRKALERYKRLQP